MKISQAKRGPVPMEEIDRVLPVRVPLQQEGRSERPGFWADGNLLELMCRLVIRILRGIANIVHLG